MNFFKKNAHVVLTLIVAFILIQSLFFKFSNSPETIYIFEGKLEPWAASLGFPGLFVRGGPSGAPVIGTFELITAIMLIIGAIINNKKNLQTLGALLGMVVISGAIFFHIFTPLGIAVVNTDGTSDRGLLFIMAWIVWLSCACLVYLRRDQWLPLIKRLINS